VIIPLDQSAGDYRITCCSCEEQTVIEEAADKDDAEQQAIRDGWSRAADDAHECPRCTNTSIERIVEQTVY